MQSLLTRTISGGRMNNVAAFDIDLALYLIGMDFQDAGITAEAFDLDNVHESDVLQSAGESFALLPTDGIVQYVEHKAEAVARNRLFEKKLRSGGKAGCAVGLMSHAR